jgi:hypothetical protein
VLIEHPSADASTMLMRANSSGATAFMLAAEHGAVGAMRELLLHACVKPAVMMMQVNHFGTSPLMMTAKHGSVDAGNVLLNHPSADAAAMMMLTNSYGFSAFMWAAAAGHVECMRQLIEHPAADAAAMMMLGNADGTTALMLAAQAGHIECMRQLLDHPSAADAAMLAVRAPGVAIASALTDAAAFAAGSTVWLGPRPAPTRSCAPLLLLLRRVAVEPQPGGDAQQAHMSKVMQVLCQGPRSNELFDDGTPDDVRDECVRLLLARGAASSVLETARPVVSRVMLEAVQLDSAHLVNKTVVGMAVAGKRPRENV